MNYPSEYDASEFSVERSDARTDDCPEPSETDVAQTSVAGSLDSITALLKQNLSQALQNIVESGALLLEAKKLLKHGHFGRWLAENFNMSSKTAHRFMSVASMVQKRQLRNDALSQLISLDLKSLYELSSKSTSEGVQDQIFKDMQASHLITYEYIRFLKTQNQLSHKPKPESITHLAKDLRTFSTFFEHHLPLMQKPIYNLEEQSRQELLMYTEKLKQTYKVLEDILASVNAVRMQEPAADEASTEAGDEAPAFFQAG